MSGPLYGNGRRDESEPEVVETFRAHGATVVQLSGKDIPDLLVGAWGRWHVVEVKTAKGKLRPGQKRWSSLCRGEAPTIARTAQDAFDLLARWQTASVIENGMAGQGGGSWAALEEQIDGCPCDACHVSNKEGPA